MPVSELEKKADRAISAANIPNSKPRGASFNEIKPISVKKAHLVLVHLAMQ